MILRRLFLCSCCLAAAHTTPALAQLAPAGFTGAINSPTADVMTPGTVGAAWNNSNPEKPRVYPGVGGFGSVNLGFGVLPGLEVAGRLAYDGDLYCSLYVISPRCQGGLRDLSGSVKYQLPLRLGWDTRLALGAVDVGGAATNFRSYYGVATASVGPFDFSLGYARGSHPFSSMDGLFGSGQIFLTEHWRATAEYDSRELRAGIRYARPIYEGLSLEAGASRKLSNRTDQQAWQAGLGLTYSFDKHSLSEGTRRLSIDSTPNVVVAVTPPDSGVPTVAKVGRMPPPSTGSSTAPEMAPKAPTKTTASGDEMVATQPQRAEQLASRLRAAGFSSVWVGFDDARRWVVLAEPLAWRKNRLDALGVALAVWQKVAQSDEQIQLTLSYLQDPVLTVQTGVACLRKFTEGGWWCDGQAALKLDSGGVARTPILGWAVAPAQGRENWRAQLEIAPVLRQRVGTEFGLYDASVGMSLRWELGLSRGVLWQGELTVPLANSPNFGNDGAFGGDRLHRRVESSTLSFQTELAPRLWAQANIGYVMHNDYGGQLDLAWLSPQGSLRLSALAGYYQGADIGGMTFESIRHPLALATARWSVIDGRWHVEAQAGQFYNQDRGIRLASHHWFGDNRLTLHYRNTEAISPILMPRTKFAGFQVSMPIGSRAATVAGPVTLRGADQWVYGIETKVGGTDNIITSGYGTVPVIRHGLLNDTLDYDRVGMVDVLANLYRVRAMLREMAGKP